MPRYIVQRTFPEGLHIPLDNAGAAVCSAVLETNAEEGVTWVHSYVSEDKGMTFCVYDAPTPEAIRKTATRNDLPVDQITQVRVLDPTSTADPRPAHPGGTKMLKGSRRTLIAALTVIATALAPSSALAMHVESLGSAGPGAPVVVVQPPQVSSGTFAWGDAGIGAAAATVALIGAGSLVLGGRRRRGHIARVS